MESGPNLNLFGNIFPVFYFKWNTWMGNAKLEVYIRIYFYKNTSDYQHSLSTAAQLWENLHAHGSSLGNRLYINTNCPFPVSVKMKSFRPR